MISVDATSFLVILAQNADEMRASTATALVGAAIISTLAFPLLGLRLRRDRPREPEDHAHRARESLATPAEAGAP